MTMDSEAGKNPAQSNTSDTNTKNTVSETMVDELPSPLTGTAMQRRAVTWRSVLLCLLLLPINSYWVVQMEVVRYSAHPTTISLLFNTIFILLCLTLLNRVVHALRAARRAGAGRTAARLFRPVHRLVRVRARHAGSLRSDADLVVQARRQHQQLGHAHQSASARTWLFITDPAIYKSYYLGNDSIWHWKYIRAWLPVVTIWTLFVSTLLFVMLCINAHSAQAVDGQRAPRPIPSCSCRCKSRANRRFSRRACSATACSGSGLSSRARLT